MGGVGGGGVQDMQHETIFIFCSDVFTAIVDVVCSLFLKKKKGLKACLWWKVHLAYPASLRALHLNI